MVKCPRCLCENNKNNDYCIECHYPLKVDKKNNEDNTPFSSWKNFSFGRKVLIIMFILFIIILAFNIVYYLNANSTSDPTIITTNKSTHSSHSPYQLKIIYSGAWSGQIGATGHESFKQGSGDELIYIKAASWDDVAASISKLDDTEENLTIQLLKNDVVIGENSTSKPNGFVSLSS